MRAAEEWSTDIDINGVTSLTMRLDGSASTSTPTKGENSDNIQDSMIQ